MTNLQALILGVIEGITEFLPISSTAHLILAAQLLNVQDTEYAKFFEVFIQSGAILAIVALYMNHMIKNKQLTLRVLISFFPTGIIGFFLYQLVKTVFFSSTALIGLSLFIVGCVFLLIEFAIKQKQLHLTHDLSKLTNKQAVAVGVAQALAVVPGVSRAGIVMITMMLMGYKRSEAALYSFLLAVPTIMAATVFDMYKSRELLMNSTTSLSPLLVGFVTSFVVAYVSVKWLIGYLQTNSLSPFGYYRIALAVLVMLFLQR